MQPCRLLLIRHATAADGPIDADRPLTGSGVHQAGAIGHWLQRGGLVPDRVLLSPAHRAVQTWEHASTGLPSVPQSVPEPRIYDNAVETLLAVIRETAEDVQTLAVVGHNPSISALASALDDGDGDAGGRRAVEQGFPTGGVAVFVLPGSFAAVAPGTATLTGFAVPGD